ncbi:MAG: LCP family protein [Actinobacteria bacterium]|nr:LCP family protein [Actinomycetota bacterium]
MHPRFEDIPRPSLWKRFLLGGFLVVFATASATAVAAFREVDRVVKVLDPGPDLQLGRAIAKVPPGKPQTVLLLGSDKRPRDARDGGAGMGARSDTIILVRLDPEREATALMSLPRDLKVQIPGHGTDKINAAYELGGAKLTLDTVKQLTGLPINHVINVDFQGFKKAVDAIGCVYLDIDRRYYNDSPGFAYIDVNRGYQKLCGEEALEYARFRHEDTDLIRGARQQDLLRETKQQVGVGNLIKDRERLIGIFGKYTTSDSELKTREGIIGLLKLAVYSVGQPIREVHFEGQITDGDEATNTPSYVEASYSTVQKLVQQFLGVQESKGPRGLAGGRKSDRGRGDGGLERAPGPGMEQAVQGIQRGAGGDLPLYFPTKRLRGSLFVDAPRVYRIQDFEGRWHKSYRIVIKRGPPGEYYGVQGTTWQDPPILQSPSEKRTMGKRDFELHYDGDRVRIVAWHTRKAVYWVSNTLLQTLSERQMLAIARSTRLP